MCSEGKPRQMKRRCEKHEHQQNQQQGCGLHNRRLAYSRLAKANMTGDSEQ